MKKTIDVNGIPVRINSSEYICLTDICKSAEGRVDSYLSNYLKNRDTLEFLSVWEEVSNPDFNTSRMTGFKLKATLNASSPSIGNWIKETQAIGFEIEKGKYGGTYAHREIAIHFMNWFDAKFYVYFIKIFEKTTNKSLEFHIKKITDNIDEARNWLDTIPNQNPKNNRIKDNE